MPAFAQGQHRHGGVVVVQHFALRRLADQLLHRGLERGGRFRDDLPLRRGRQRNAQALLQVFQAIQGKPAAVVEQRDHAGRGRVVLLFAHAGGSFGGEHFAAQIAAQLLQFVHGGRHRRLASHPHQHVPAPAADRLCRADTPGSDPRWCNDRHVEPGRWLAPRYASAPLRPWPAAGFFAACCLLPVSLLSDWLAMPACSSTASVFSLRARHNKSAQALQGRFALLQQLGHVAQRADRRFQFLISGLAQRFRARPPATPPTLPA